MMTPDDCIASGSDLPPPDSVRPFTFRRPLGQTTTVRAERVVFTASHVVFYIGNFIVSAEQASAVNELREIAHGETP